MNAEAAVQKVSWGKLSLRQVAALFLANIKARYRKTVAGFLWVLISPLVTFGIQSLIFSHILKLNIDRYPIFLLSALLPWIFVSQTMDMCTGIFVNSGRLLKSYAVHPLVYLAAQVVDNTVNFFASLLVVIVLCYSDIPNLWTVSFLPIPILSLFFGTFAVSWILATVHVFFRDTKFLISFVMHLMFFMTPIFYPTELLPNNLRWLAWVNPVYPMIKPFRSLIYEANLEAFVHDAFMSLSISAVFMGLAFLLWRRVRNELYFNL